MSDRHVYEMIARLAAACRIDGKLERDHALRLVQAAAVGCEAGIAASIELACDGEGVRAEAVDDGAMWAPPARSTVVNLGINDPVSYDGPAGVVRGTVAGMDMVGVDVGGTIIAVAPSALRRGW